VSARIAIPAIVTVALVWGLAILGGCVLVLVVGVTGTAVGAGARGAVTTYAPSTEAYADIPPAYLALYRRSAARFGLDWTVLAGIGRVECDHGRDPAPSCTVEGQLNYAGAGGPAQFLVPTWREYGLSASGGVPDMWNPADAVLSMANYLHAAGAPADYPKAIYAYNHAWWYVDEVLAWARRYRAQYGPAAAAAVRVTTPNGYHVRRSRR